MAAAMSDLNHPLAAEPHSRMNDTVNGESTGGHGPVSVRSGNNGQLIENASTVVSEIIPSGYGDGKAGGGPLGMPDSNAPDDSLALGLNLALVPEALSKNFNSTPSNATASGSNSTGASTGSNTTMPTPLTISNGKSNSVDNSNPATSKNTGMSGLRSGLHSIASDHSSPIMSADISTNTMRMFQRMDEISARLIAMEEMFQKLCKSVEQQSSTISDLKLENAQMSKDILQKVDSIPAQSGQSADAGVQDTFVTDLLNSITNVSSAYLRRMRPQSRTNKNQFDSTSSKHPGSEMDSNFRSGRDGQSDGFQATSDQLRNFEDRQGGHAAFTLNPNGIKRRKKTDLSSDNLTASGFNSASLTSAAQSYKDLTSLNAFGTISLPNLTLDHTGMTPLLRNGSHGMSFARMHDAGNGGMLHQGPSQGQQSEVSSLPQTQVSHPLRNGVTNTPQNGPEKHQDDDDEGYQEDDDEDNDSDGSDEDDGDEAINDDLGHRAESVRSAPLQESAAFNAGQHSWKNQDAPNGSLAGKGDRVNLVNGNESTANSNIDKGNSDLKDHSERERVMGNVNDMNYTLLKAPSNVRTIWDEYTVGIRGHPPIKKLEERFGNKWRLNRNRKTYARRKRLYKFIINGINKGKTADEMINTLEDRRLYKDENGEIKRRTIGWLQQSLTGI